jgi:Phage integrase, N-terminal SAM-like domain
VTHLRKMMLEELQRRNYAETTIDCYIRVVEDFSRRFHLSPDRLGPRHIREYQAELFQKQKLATPTVRQHLAAFTLLSCEGHQINGRDLVVNRGIGTTSYQGGDGSGGELQQMEEERESVS